MKAVIVAIFAFSILAALSVTLTNAASDNPSAPAPASAEQQAFTDITVESGVDKIVKDKYAADPKWWLSGLHLVDLDGDGRLDLFLSGHGTEALATLGDGHGRFTLAPGDYPKTEIHVPYDIDEDGKLDLSMTWSDGGGQWWLNRSAPGRLHFEPTDMKRGGNTCRQQAMIDADRDGNVDWLRGTAPGIVFDLGDGTGRFAEGSLEIAVESGKQDGLAVIPADLDGDGFIDLVAMAGAYTYEPCKTHILRGSAGFKFTDVTADSGIPQDQFAVKGVGDFDQDGDLDLIAIENRKEFSIWLNDGHARFVKKEGALPGIGGGINYPYWGLAAVTDIDNDGVADIIMDGRNFLKILRGTGGGVFESMNTKWGITDAATAAVDEGVCFGDIDGDGDLDVVGFKEIYPSRTFAVYRNDLPAKNWLNVRPIGAPHNAGAAGAKIRVFEPGGKSLLWFEQIQTYCKQAAQSYYAYAVTERHFGLGSRDSVDVEVVFYPSGKSTWSRNVKANTTIELREMPAEAK